MIEQMECFLCPAYGIRAYDINNGLCFDSQHPLIMSGEAESVYLDKVKLKSQTKVKLLNFRT